MKERALDHMDTIPEDATSLVDDPKSIDGILARLSEIERRLDEKADNSITKQVANMEESFKGINEDLLLLIPNVEKELSRLNADMKQGMVQMRAEVFQITDKVVASTGPAIGKLFKDLETVSNRVDKLESLLPDAVSKLDRASAELAESMSKDSKSGKDVTDNASTTSGSFASTGSQTDKSANMKSTESTGATHESPALSDDGVSTNSSDAKPALEAKATPSPQEQLAAAVDETVTGWCSAPEQIHQDVAARLKIFAAAAERGGPGADLLSKSTGSIPSWATMMARTCSQPASPKSSSRSISKEHPRRVVNRDPLTVIPANISKCSQSGGSARLPIAGVELTGSVKTVRRSTSRPRTPSADRGMQGTLLLSMSSNVRVISPRSEAAPRFSSPQRSMPLQTMVYEKQPVRSIVQVQSHCKPGL
mmetsp:Transcript_34926/g.64655  ORF Transcript_34926/g.64655 Transcript_34926/m.64655 type:complete len:422 (-) Transcript_34926:119-1384(-)